MKISNECRNKLNCKAEVPTQCNRNQNLWLSLSYEVNVMHFIRYRNWGPSIVYPMNWKANETTELPKISRFFIVLSRNPPLPSFCMYFSPTLFFSVMPSSVSAVKNSADRIDGTCILKRADWFSHESIGFWKQANAKLLLEWNNLLQNSW